MCEKCNWFSKIFGCKCSCQKKDEAAPAVTPTPVDNETKPAAAQPDSAEKIQ